MSKRLFSMFVLSVAMASGIPSPVNAAAPVILVLGDSLSSGYGLADDVTWVALLQQRLAARDYRHRVVNASISGDTTANGLLRLRPALARHRPSIVLVELGGNDGLRGLSLNALRDNLAAMVAAAREYDAKVVLAGMRLPPNYGIAYAAEFARVFQEIADTYSVALIDFFMDGVATVSGMMQDDNIHPSAEAQPVLLDNAWQALEALLSP